MTSPVYSGPSSKVLRVYSDQSHLSLSLWTSTCSAYRTVWLVRWQAETVLLIVDQPRASAL